MIHNLANNALRNSKISCYLCLPLATGNAVSDFIDGVIVQFRGSVFIATANRSMRDSVSKISLSCIPAKVIDATIGSIAVIVASIHFLWTWPNEGRKNKDVNLPAKRATITANGYARIATFIWSWTQPVPSIALAGQALAVKSIANRQARPNTSVRTNSISREVRNVFVLNARVARLHAHDDLQTGCRERAVLATTGAALAL